MTDDEPRDPPGLPDEPAERRGSSSTVRGVTLLLLALLVVVAALAPRLAEMPQVADAQRVAQGPPEVVAPEGALAEAYDLARPAAVRIEARCRGNRRAPAVGVGSGFFIEDDGTVLTAYHVVEGAGGGPCPLTYWAVGPGERDWPLELVGFDAYFDLAVLEADVAEQVPYVPLAEDGPRPGDDVVAIGNSRGAFLEARAGRVTRVGVEAGRADFADGTVELTASLAPGDSGGPVVNAAGHAVGVVSYISFTPGALDSDAYVPPFLRGLSLPTDFASYAVPVTRGSDLVDALVAGERRDVPVVGFEWRQGFDYDPRSSDLDFGRRPGPIVVRVAPGGPADRAGLRSYQEEPVRDEDGDVLRVRREGDVIVAVDGEATPDFYALLDVIRRKSIGETVTLTVQRGNATLSLDLTLGAKRDVFTGE